MGLRMPLGRTLIRGHLIVRLGPTAHRGLHWTVIVMNETPTAKYDLQVLAVMITDESRSLEELTEELAQGAKSPVPVTVVRLQ